MADIIHALAKVLEERKTADPETSYVASLYEEGTGRILEKIEEEAGELIEAVKEKLAGEKAPGTKNAEEKNHKHIVHETADLWFHTLVLLCALGVHPDEVLGELERRFGASGHEEKARREPPGK